MRSLIQKIRVRNLKSTDIPPSIKLYVGDPTFMQLKNRKYGSWKYFNEFIAM